MIFNSLCVYKIFKSLYIYIYIYIRKATWCYPGLMDNIPDKNIIRNVFYYMFLLN